jgi:hypothetical protein
MTQQKDTTGTGDGVTLEQKLLQTGLVSLQDYAALRGWLPCTESEIKGRLKQYNTPMVFVTATFSLVNYEDACQNEILFFNSKVAGFEVTKENRRVSEEKKKMRGASQAPLSSAEDDMDDGKAVAYGPSAQDDEDNTDDGIAQDATVFSSAEPPSPIQPYNYIKPKTALITPPSEEIPPPSIGSSRTT